MELNGAAMDAELRKAFIVAAETCGKKRVFQSGGGSLSDFLHSQREQNDPKQVAASILDYFCFEDGRFNEFFPGVKLALLFLDATLEGPQGEAQRVRCWKDLKEVLVSPGTKAAILDWIRTNYH